MSANAGGTGVAQPQAAPSPPTPKSVSPNQYQLSGGGLTVSYFPNGRGPIGPAGAIHMIYQDAHQTLSFRGDQVRTVEVPDVGTLVSVSIQETVDVGSTSFTLIVPAVQLPDMTGSAAHIHTDGITTTHRVFVGLIGHSQAESYVVTKLSGTASNAILPA